MNNTTIQIVPIICGVIIGLLLMVNSRITKENTELTEQLMYAKEGREYFLEVATRFRCMQPRQTDIRDCLLSKSIKN